ncbi:hypothetical protein ACIBCT_20820 [Streptosporangium sp. NPDC050855]|uniref:hypothetical protein n=1 Tax=Streptosporangium sp. NPDC050855 TaxID=3366194 RepID=UPI003797BBF1
MAERSGIDALDALFRAEYGPPVGERIALNMAAEDMTARQLLSSVTFLQAERERLYASLVTLVRKVGEDQMPDYYEDLVPADVLAAAFPEEARRDISPEVLDEVVNYLRTPDGDVQAAAHPSTTGEGEA